MRVQKRQLQEMFAPVLDCAPDEVIVTLSFRGGSAHTKKDSPQEIIPHVWEVLPFGK
jgi:hypothetical protein